VLPKALMTKALWRGLSIWPPRLFTISYAVFGRFSNNSRTALCQSRRTSMLVSDADEAAEAVAAACAKARRAGPGCGRRRGRREGETAAEGKGSLFLETVNRRESGPRGGVPAAERAAGWRRGARSTTGWGCSPGARRGGRGAPRGGAPRQAVSLVWSPSAARPLPILLTWPEGTAGRRRNRTLASFGCSRRSWPPTGTPAAPSCARRWRSGGPARGGASRPGSITPPTPGS
jgi:hypothetical protein